MKIGLKASVVMASMLLAGCKGFWNASSTTGCTSSCSTTITSGNFYVLNSNEGQIEIAGYSIVQNTLTALTGSPYTLPSGPYAIAVAPNGSFLYVSTQSGIYLYSIGSTGGLKLASTTPIATDYAAYSMQVDATDSWLVEASGSGYLYAIPVNSSTGATTGTVQQISLAGITPRQLAISPDNTKVFVALSGAGTEVVPFTASSADPLPKSVGAPIAPAGVAGGSISVAVDPSDRLLYIGETLGTSGSANTGVLRAFLSNSLGGTPTEVTGSPFPSGGITPAAILPEASGAYVYVANATVSNSTTGGISGFSVTASGTSYSVTSLSNTATSAGTTPAGLAEDSTGSVVLLVNSGGNPDLDVYSFDATTLGQLDATFTFATGTDPVGARAIAAAP
jgi:6-phosphogluconolactonase (cycloisomerase 2 family)